MGKKKTKKISLTQFLALCLLIANLVISALIVFRYQFPLLAAFEEKERMFHATNNFYKTSDRQDLFLILGALFLLAAFIFSFFNFFDQKKQKYLLPLALIYDFLIILNFIVLHYVQKYFLYKELFSNLI